jgi:hypothetical protein
VREAVSIVFLICALTACSTLRPENISVDGAIWSVSDADIRAALSACSPVHGEGKVYAVQVMSIRELHIFREPRTVALVTFEVVRKINGMWRDEGRIISGTEY